MYLHIKFRQDPTTFDKVRILAVPNKLKIVFAIYIFLYEYVLCKIGETNINHVQRALIKKTKGYLCMFWALICS